MNQKIRIYLNIFLLLIFFVLFFLYFSPLGCISYQKNFSKKQGTFLGGKGAIYKLGPKDRLLDDNKIIGEPAYFYLKTNRAFDKAQMEIEYEISDEVFKNNPYIDLSVGLLLNKDNWNYKLYPLYNNILNSLSDNWQRDDGIIFWQRENKFSNLDEYLQAKDFSSLLTYNYKLDNDFILRDYQAQNNEYKIPKLRGSHIFYTYLKDENLKFDFSLKNLDSSSEEKVDIFVYLNQDVVFSKNFSAEELKTGSSFSLDLADLPEAVYKIEIRTSDNIIIEDFVSYLDKLVFLNKLNLYESSDGFHIFSNKANLRVKSLDAKCLGKIKINDDSFELDQIFKQFNFKSFRQDLNTISSPSCGMLIESDALFSFSPESFFNPLITNLSADVSLDDYDFIIADYRHPEKKNNSYISNIEIDLKNAQREKNEYRFIISAPFLKGDNSDEYVLIKKIKIKLQGKNIFEKIKEVF